jgi:enediyne biosynthesis protein E5
MDANPQTRLLPPDRWYSEKRLGGLSRFAFAITILNIAGHCFLGFEQSWITPFAAVGAAYATEFLGETIDAWMHNRRPRYLGSFLNVVKFLLPAHISGLAVGMLLYAAENAAAIAFAASAAIASKYLLRMVVGTDSKGQPAVRHFLNPSNFGITITLLLFPTVGIAPPYQFTENTSGIVDWILPIIIIISGSYLNTKATGRIPLILAWVSAFALQAVFRAELNGTPIEAGLLPMTGFAFILFTFYMITDPATSPSSLASQIGFAAAVAFCYAMFMELHIVFGLFYSLTIVTAVRGSWVALKRLDQKRRAMMVAAPATMGMTPAE